MLLKFINSKASFSLVERCGTFWPNAMWVTVNPNPGTKHKTTILKASKNGYRRVNVTLPYGKMRQREQMQYCLDYIRKTYWYSRNTKFFGSWELTESGNVHLHLVMSDPNIKGKSTLQMFQRDTLNSEEALRNMSSKSMTDWMNSICFVNDSIEKRYTYLTKEIDENIEIMPYFATMNCPITTGGTFIDQDLIKMGIDTTLMDTTLNESENDFINRELDDMESCEQDISKIFKIQRTSHTKSKQFKDMKISIG